MNQQSTPSPSAVATLDAMAARAQRHLDGMTVNRDAMARDVLKLVDAIQSAQRRATRRSGAAGSGPYSGVFADIFDDLFGGRPL